MSANEEKTREELGGIKQIINPENLAVTIRNKALELGFDSCGIIKVDAVRDYADRLEERMKLCPESRPFYENLFKYAYPRQTYDWARSIIVCAFRYGKYRIPEGVSGLIGKFYLYDYHLQKYSKEFSNAALFESYLQEAGLKTVRNEIAGIAAARWAAFKAGLGAIRKNNFFYTRHGSWIMFETWLTDQEMECSETEVLPPCPDNCTKCIDACPTGALAGPYETNAVECMTFLTCWVKDSAPEHLRDKMGTWLYGCDACQDACPMNKGKWDEEEDYPNLDELVNYIGIEKMFQMDEETFSKHIQPKFWYINQDRVWLWKCNTIRAMANSYEAKYGDYIRQACHDSNENVREMAVWACAKLGL